jgi:hypothetical protein
MQQKTPKTQGNKTPNARDARLKAALKANMAKRKAQAKGRAANQSGDDVAGDGTSKEDKG